MDLFLFTSTFPFRKAEPFLINEFDYTKKYFDTITVFPFYGKFKDLCVAPDPKVQVLPPFLNSPDEKKKIFIKGFFNLEGCRYHLQDLFREKLFLSPKKMYWFFISLLITRMCLSSKSYKKMVAQVNSSTHPVLYFYWGDNQCWVIPYLRRKWTAKNLKIVIRLHRTDLYEDLKDNYAPLRKQVFAMADLIIPISEDGRNYLSRKYPEFKDKITLSRLGVFDNGLNPVNKAQTKHIVSVSNLVEVKRVNLIFDALQKTKANIVWHHFGDGQLAEKLKETVQQKRDGLDVIWYGFISNKSLMDFYKTQGIDLFINLSASEGLPVSIMEALSFGIPVIATNTGGTSELVDEGVGKLIDVDFDMNELSKEIDRMLMVDAAESYMLRKNARNYFETKANAPVNYENFYKSILSLF